MKHRSNWIIYILSSALLLVALLCGKLDTPVPSSSPVTPVAALPFHVQIAPEHAVSLWYNGADTYYAFLPGHVSFSRLTLVPETPEPVYLNGRLLDPESPQQVAAQTPYILEWPGNSEIQDTQYVVFLQSDALPSLHVDVRSGNMHYIHQFKGNEESGSMRLIGSDGTTLYSGNLKSIKGRGNATWDEPKKPYTLELNMAANLLGMGSAEKWILLPNCLDPSNLRNKLIFDYAEELGLPYTPQCQWVDLYLNGEYTGLYLLCEKNEVHEQRIDVPMDSGFLVAIEKPDRVKLNNRSYFITQAGVPVRIYHSGNPRALPDQFQSLENALMADDGVDPITGRHWQELIDLDSWVEKYLIEEISGNLDAGAISQYFYGNGSGQIFAGPIWDYDMSCGNLHTWQIDTPNMLYAGRPHLWSLDDPSSWYYSLSQKEPFRQRLQELYETQFRPVLLKLLDDIPLQESTIRNSALMNMIRWNYSDPSAEAAQFQDYMYRRMDFLDSLWLKKNPCHTVEVWINCHILACYAVADGETIPYKEVPYGTDTLIYEGWYNYRDDSLFDFTQPIQEDTQIYLKETNLNALSADSSPASSLTSIIKYVPITALGVLFLSVLLWEIFRSRSQNQNKEKHTHTVGVTTHE